MTLGLGSGSWRRWRVVVADDHKWTRMDVNGRRWTRMGRGWPWMERMVVL